MTRLDPHRKLVAEWRRLAEAEPDERKRGDYAGLTLVFSELAGCRNTWDKGLEGFNVQRSAVTLEWEARGRADGQLKDARAKLLRALEVRFKTPVSPEVAEAVQAQDDQATVDRWFDLALTANTLDEVRAAFGLNGA